MSEAGKSKPKRIEDYEEDFYADSTCRAMNRNTQVDKDRVQRDNAAVISYYTYMNQQ